MRWEDPRDDEIKVLLGQDDYGAFHLVAVPPIYLKRERGPVNWLASALPDLIDNRSLRRVAFRSSAWASSDPSYADKPADDPKHTVVLLVEIAEKGRYESWQAPIRRSPGGLPALGDWKLDATIEDGLGGIVPKLIRTALDRTNQSRGPTMPAANMVLGPWDVPHDFFPLETLSGPGEHGRGNVVSSFIAFYRAESAGPAILSQAIVSNDADKPAEWISAAAQSLTENESLEFYGPPVGTESHFFKGAVDRRTLGRYTAVWRYPGVFCELALLGPPGRFTEEDISEYANLQHRRASAELGWPVKGR